LKPKIGVVCHDSGGAELVSRLLKRTDADYLYSVLGPAVLVFKRNVGFFENIELTKTVEESDFLICGTSWQSTHENEAICLAKETNKRVVSVLDHYSCYLERFVKSGFSIIPNELWVTDKKSRALAREIAPSAIIKIVGNPYLDEMKLSFDKLKKPNLSEDDFEILYLSEPYAQQAVAQYGDKNHWKFNELSAFEFLISNVAKITNRSRISVSIRHHPAEEPEKYKHLVGRRQNIDIKLSANGDLLTEMAASHAVVGVDTLAMLLALRIGKPVYSALPPLTIEPTLPPDGIIYLREL
jgi:hypothetical protein